MGKLIGYVKSFLKKGDMLLLFLCVTATVFGIVAIASATNYRGSGRFLLIQSMALLLGILLYMVVTLVDIDIFAGQRTLLVAFNTVFIGMLLIWGVEGSTGNRSWLEFSFLPFNIQPAEICKITFIVILAKTMSLQKDHVSSLRSVSQITLHTLYIVGLIIVVSKDAGVALTFVVIFIVMAYTGGIFDSSIDPSGLNERYHMMRSMDTLSGGGLTGQGLFHGSTVQRGGLFAQHTDFIFSSIGEELGLLGCVAVLVLLAAIVIRCIYVGVHARSYMNRMICFGIAAMLIFQIGVNVGMCLGVFPVIGLTLPFFSYGGAKQQPQAVFQPRLVPAGQLVGNICPGGFARLKHDFLLAHTVIFQSVFPQNKNCLFKQLRIRRFDQHYLAGRSFYHKIPPLPTVSPFLAGVIR